MPPWSNASASLTRGLILCASRCPHPADAGSLGKIREKLRSRGYQTPLIADVHFNAAIALKAATVAEKVRINPGNFGISGKFQKSGYTQEEYNAEWEKQRKRIYGFSGPLPGTQDRHPHRCEPWIAF